MFRRRFSLNRSFIKNEHRTVLPSFCEGALGEISEYEAYPAVVAEVGDDDEFAGIQTRRLSAAVWLLDAVAAAVGEAIFYLPLACLSASWQIVHIQRIKGDVSVNALGGVRSLILNHGLQAFFTSLPWIIGVQALDSALSLLPRLYCYGGKKTLSRHQEAAFHVSSAIILAPLKVATEIQFARDWSLRVNNKTTLPPESLISTCRSMEPWALGSRLLCTFWCASTRRCDVGHGESCLKDWWSIQMPHFVCQMMPLTCSANDRRSLLNIICQSLLDHPVQFILSFAFDFAVHSAAAYYAEILSRSCLCSIG